MIANRLVVSGVFVLALGGCGSKWIDYAATGPRRPEPPRPARGIRVFTTARPVCPYDEIGILESNQTGLSWWSSATDVIEAMKERAASAGGDAIVITDHNDSHHGGHGYTGVVIQFRPACDAS